MNHLSTDTLVSLPLLVAHFTADFVFQSDRMVRDKHRVGVLLTHALIAGALAWLFAGLLAAWWIPLVTFLSHALIDHAKLRLDSLRKPHPWIFWLDQLAHLAVIAGLVAFHPDRFVPPSIWSELLGLRNALVIWSVALGAVLTIPVGAVLIGRWCEPWRNEITASGPNDDRPPARGLARAGRVIGMWERAMIFLLTMMGALSAIGFLVAAKSVFRFGEFSDPRNRMEAEYILIGTLMSFFWAMAVGWLTQLGLERLPDLLLPAATYPPR